jgi:hypothetical protein
MQTDHTLPDSAPAITTFLRELQGVSGRSVGPSSQSLTAWMEVADASAIEVQHRLDRTKNTALRVTLASIVCLAVLAVVLRTPAPQVLCPFAVFLMILFSDRQRCRADVFRFTSLRLAAETLRIIQAVHYKPDQLAMVLSSRRLSTHAVVSLAAKACEASRVLLAGETQRPNEHEGEGFWSAWISEQGAYYGNASAREKNRAKWARSVFNAAFGFVGFVGIAAAIWSLSAPAQMATDAFRIFMAVASATGSCGLAYMSHVRDKKAFDQSFDYGHLSKVFWHDGPDFESIAVNESMSEHVRWALRMAGHFEYSPLTKTST